MELKHRMEVPAPIEVVWPLLIDLQGVAPCLPGATLGERFDDGSYHIGIAVKLGPMQLNYKGHVGIVETDGAARRAVMRVKAREQRGQGTAEATVTMTLSMVDGGTAADMLTDLRLTGRVAQMGRGIVADVSNRLLAEFSDCINARASAATTPGATSRGASAETPDAAPIRGLSLFFRILSDRLRRLVGRRSA